MHAMFALMGARERVSAALLCARLCLRGLGFRHFWPFWPSATVPGPPPAVPFGFPVFVPWQKWRPTWGTLPHEGVSPVDYI